MEYLLLGILLGILMSKYIFPFLDTKLEIFYLNESKKATEIQLDTQALSFEFVRKYPESQDNPNQELHPAIGFAYTPKNEFEDEEIYCKKNKIGFIK